MNSSNMNKPALILIDVQIAFDDIDYWGGSRNNPHAEQNIAALLSYWRRNDLPLFHVKHNSDTEGSLLSISSPGNAFKKEATPLNDEIIVEKSVNSAFIGTNLQQSLNEQGIKTVMIAGFITEHCVSTTARMAANLGFETYVIKDATVSFAKRGVNGESFTADVIHAVSLATLQDEFATIITSEQAKTLSA
ncbi:MULTISPECIES: cysteine hydrolase family protein [unclassified Mucilaginibacter]|uniref:cysteine hydrolase family protein n=1 Tax=unclassified Mucilaginibacter TaxID=2617802 RepID=UPI002AC9ACA6|nr:MULTISPECIES: cysteine hydrolase family protein [unclassified Mucilaginibacter]MEB0277107.1 cysteine hydrolase family protein [Mucilaginibacter sp. 10B2]MEB0301827.1 cysteine hydrolase family protein [Mucilaginibacter sp. 5C4]WPX25207.1 cysteine hydrolase family protein [Mucilaginibacter sp. 5C4]